MWNRFKRATIGLAASALLPKPGIAEGLGEGKLGLPAEDSFSFCDVGPDLFGVAATAWPKGVRHGYAGSVLEGGDDVKD